MNSFEPLASQYLYTSARFLLVIIALSLMLSAITIGGIITKSESYLKQGMGPIEGRHIATGICLALVLVSFVPGYAQTPSHLKYINPKERYNWEGIETAVSDLGGPENVFLVDRAREFAWLTDRKTASLILPEKQLEALRATEALNNLSQRFSADYLVMDAYTIAHWDTLNHLLSIPMVAQQDIPLNISTLLQPNSLGTQIALDSLHLEEYTEQSEADKQTRIFRFLKSEFNRVWYTENLGSEWLASGTGTIINATRNNQLIIGENETYTNTWRRADDSLNVDINGGFMLIEVEEVNATIPRVTVKNATYEYSAQADKLSNSVYYYPLGDFTVGDIRVVCEGDPGDRIIIKSMSIWQAVY
jgi:hypothetical protein